MPSIAVGKGMNRDHAMVKADCDFVARVGLMLDPIIDVGEQCMEFRLDTISFDTDIALGLPICAGPAPDVAQHPFVQLSHKMLGQDVGSAA